MNFPDLTLYRCFLLSVSHFHGMLLNTPLRQI